MSITQAISSFADKYRKEIFSVGDGDGKIRVLIRSSALLDLLPSKWEGYSVEYAVDPEGQPIAD